MQASGSTTMNASREKVWTHLTNPDFVAKCVPGFESMEVVEENKKYKGTGSVGLGNLKVRISGDVEFVTLEAPTRAVIKGRGTAPGSVVEGTAEMKLRDGEDGSTIMDWTVDVNVMGTIASLASRMMNSMAQKLSGQFFDCVKQQLES
ncbi:MAG: carbon monoxide dehydrogenase subunit G [Anaerolineales bacterium]